MKIATKLSLAALVPALMALVIGLAVVCSYKMMEESRERGQTAQRIMNSANNLTFLAQANILGGGERSRLQFEAEQATLKRLIVSARFTNEDQIRLLSRIRESTEATNRSFQRLYSDGGNGTPPERAALHREAQERLAGHILVRSHEAWSAALRLESLINDEIAAMQTRINSLILALIVFTTLPFTLVLARLRRTATASLLALLKGTEVVGAGDLDYRISMKSRDEIGAVSLAFDRMAASLQSTTASKTELEQENTERQRAEESLRKALEELDIRAEELESMNEELAVANEDIQATNEELRLANDGLHLEMEERKRAEEQLQDMASLPQENPNPIMRISADGDILLCNPAGDLLLRCWDPHSGSRLPDGLMAASVEALKAGRVSEFEVDCGERVFSFLLAPILSRGHVNLYGLDITARKQAEEAVRRSQETFSELVERAPFGIYIIDSEFRIAHMNAASQDGAFRNVRPIIGRPFNEAMHILWPDDVAEGIIAVFRHTLETGEPYYSPRFVNPRHDVEIVEAYEWELHRMTLPGGQYGVICYYYDSTDLRQAEAALRESEERLRLAQQVARIGTFEWNIQTGVNTWTPELEAMYGLPAGGFPGTQDAWESMVHPEDRDQAVEQVSQALEKGGFEAEFRVIWPDGSVHWLAGRAWVFKDESGNPLRLLGVNIDITELKQAEEALAASHEELEIRVEERTAELKDAVEAAKVERQRLFDVLETLPAMICLLTEDYHVAFANRSFREAFGESNGRHCYDYCFGKPEPCDFCESYKTLETGQPHRWEVRPPGSDKIIDAYDFPFTDTDGTPMILEMDIDITAQRKAEIELARHRAHLEDMVKERTNQLQSTNEQLVAEIAERQRAEEAVRESEEKFRTMVESIPQLAWMAEPDGFIFWYNQRWYKYTGTTPEQMEGWGWQSVHDPEVLPKVMERWKASIATGQPFSMEFPLLGADGKFRAFLTRVTPVKDSEGHVQRWFGTNTDVSEARELEAHKREFYRKTILTATGGKFEIVDRENVMASLDGKPIATWEFSTLAEYSSVVSQTFELAAGLGLKGENLHRFKSCAGEMLSNAVKHAGGGEARLCTTDSRVVFAVSDTGPGIDSINLPDVAFLRGYSTAGTGGFGYKLIIGCADKTYLATGSDGTTVAVEIELDSKAVGPAAA